jgi:hypothetical protein
MPTKEQLELMVEAGGGRIVSQLFLWSTRSTATAHHHHSDEPTRHIILYDQASEGVMSLRKMKMELRSVGEMALSLGKRVQVVHHKEFLESIASYDIDILDADDPFVDQT